MYNEKKVIGDQIISENRSELIGNNLDEGLKIMSDKINNEFKYFLSADGSVDSNSSDYLFLDKSEHRKLVEKKENSFAFEENISVVEWLKKRENVSGIITEKVITLLLHKIVGDKFIIARSSKYDDYKNGIDTLIIDKETGDLICGFDEMGASLEEVQRVKGKKIEESLDHGGVTVKYGANIKRGRLIKTSRKNLPAFFLALSDNDLDNILETVTGDEISSYELRVFGQFLEGLDYQLVNIYQKYFNDKYPEEGDDLDFSQKRKDLLTEKEALINELGEVNWTKTDRGFNWKNRMNRNSLRLNLKNFQKSLVFMKNRYKDLK
jgi:hypothetical protein